ncbi:hypothetical protein POTOM_017480 [Populus tomentosa]|uniref:GOLD domain-containing protein n=1 Tax=Populus tomentosa TaxID=118781 RepID=A0A8X8D468_POPTO|nr:hypothetical protein POTOM_017480 [Populus tomentosa]
MNNSVIVGKYNVVSPNEGYPLLVSHKLTVRVASPHGNNYHHRVNVDSGNFAFTAAEVMELELKKLLDAVKSIHEEMNYLCGREEEMQHLNQSTNSKMAGLSFLSIVACLSVAGLQLWHLKSYFERKKLL